MKEKTKSIIFFVTSICTLILISIVSLAAIGFLDYDFKTNIFLESYLDDSNFKINREFANELNQYYHGSDSEFSGCLNIEQINHFSDDKKSLDVTYLITGMVSKIKISGVDYSVNELCDYGTIHSHPQGTDFFSLADINAFKSRIKTGEIVAVIIHGEDEFTYITRNDFVEKKVIIDNEITN